jgi:hypothetical protein
MIVDDGGKTLGWGLAMFGRDPADKKEWLANQSL